MRKMLGIVAIIFIFLIFGFSVFNSKRDDYNLNKQFYSNNFYTEVTKIERGRGTKIFYNSNDFFYTHFCSNYFELEKNIKVGDVVNKQDSLLEIFRDNNKKELFKILTVTVQKPADSYFSYFFE